VEVQALQARAAAVAAWGWHVVAATAGAGGDGRQSSSGGAVNGPAASGSPFTLTAIPLVCGVPLGALDLKLFLHQLAEHSGEAGGVAQPPGVGRVLRSRACRSAIMFNDPLLEQECASLVDALAATALPFCCAHGRPTTAPLVDMRVLPRALRAHGSEAAADIVLAPRRRDGFTVARLARLLSQIQ
jgi:DNA mismatch repair protein MLH3